MTHWLPPTVELLLQWFEDDKRAI